MSVSFGSIALLCILSAAVLGFSIVFSFFLLMWCGCCHVSDDDVEADTRRRNGGRQEMVTGSNGEQPVVVPDPERRGIPLNSKAPKLTLEQEQMRDKALEKYKRRKARQERRRERQIAREARVSNVHQREDGEAEGGAEDDYDGASSVTSRTTLTSAATTVRTASTAAYGRGSYLLPPPRLCGANMDDDDDDEDEELRSVHSHSSRRTTGTAKSQGTVATIKSYMRHRQRQRLRRREEQQQVDLFNQWAQAQMASSSELSPSSKSSGVSSVHSQDEARSHHHQNHKKSNGARNNGTAGGDRSQRHRGTLESSMNGGYDYRVAQPRQRSSSVASSAPRPPEEILGAGHTRYSFMQTGSGAAAVAPAAAGKGANVSRDQAHLQAGFPATPNTFRAHPDFASHAVPYTPNSAGGGEGEYSGAALPPVQTPVGESLHADPQQLPPPPPRRHRRTWKDVEHRVAMSGFFNSPANNSFGGPDATYDDGEAPAPFRGSSAEPSHSPLGRPSVPRE